MIGRAIGTFFSVSRDAVARGLIALRITPNKLTLLGMALTAVAGVFYAIGAGDRFALTFDPHAAANVYMLLAGVMLVLSSACDMLDGAVARLGNLKTPFGGFLDSTLDRCSDFAVFAGIALYYANAPRANLTFVLLSMVAFLNAFMISYTRARAEDIVGQCRGGYWQRGERSAAILIASFAYNIPALVVQQALFPLFTVLLRIAHTKAMIEGKTPVTDGRQGPWWIKSQPWRWPRMTLPYDLITGLNIAWLIFAPIEPVDLLRIWIGK